MSTTIRVTGVSKHYRIGTKRAGEYRTLRETIMSAAAAPWRRLRQRHGSVRNDHEAENTLWALQDVSFEVKAGETVGIIGRNGAGKSTLLKILSRITEPTEGRAEYRGRIGSLLEVGTGFHPELTGRENIFLNGAILGMRRQEIRRRFDEIVAFAEIERFLDMPVKRYSSGMYVRLAFAVAAHLEPEILIVDEVLAVGDVAFQKKCLDKMKDVGRDGRTVLFVSHNLAALKALCQRGIMLERGRLAMSSSISEAIAHYLGGLETMAVNDLAHRTDRRGAGLVRLMKIEFSGDGTAYPGQALMGHATRFIVHLDKYRPGVSCVITVLDCYGGSIVRFNSSLGSCEDISLSGAEPLLICTVPEMLLAPGRYRIDVALHAAGELQDQIEAAGFFQVIRGTVRGREPPRRGGEWLVAMPHIWQAPR